MLANNYISYFNSPTELAEFMDRPNVDFPSYRSHLFAYNDGDKDKILNGEKRTYTHYKAELDKITSENRKEKIEFNKCGFRPSISNFLKGNPLNMLNYKRCSEELPKINLIIDMTFSKSVSDYSISKIGARLLSSIERLELEGMSVGIYAVCSSGDKRDVMTLMCKIKDVGEPLDIVKISYFLGNPRFLRATYLNWASKVKNLPYIKNYGAPLFYFFSKDELSLTYSYFLGEKAGYLYFNSFDTNISEETMLKEIKSLIENVNKTVFL